MGDWHGAPVLPITRKQWEEARRRPSLIELCRLIEAGNEELKRRLPVWTPHCGLFENNHRSIADALAMRFGQGKEDFKMVMVGFVIDLQNDTAHVFAVNNDAVGFILFIVDAAFDRFA